MNRHFRFAAVAALALGVTLPSVAPVGSALARQAQGSQVGASSVAAYEVPARYKQTVTTFEGRVKEYSKMREALEDKMPKLAKESTPEQIDAHKTVFRESVRAARAGAKPGNLLTPDVVNYIRATIRKEFKGAKLRELRASVLEAETQGVPLAINQTYPENKELVDMPPTLLLMLPQLTKHVKYRFVGRNMLLVDRENGLILDYMRDALP